MSRRADTPSTARGDGDAQPLPPLTLSSTQKCCNTPWLGIPDQSGWPRGCSRHIKTLQGPSGVPPRSPQAHTVIPAPWSPTGASSTSGHCVPLPGGPGGTGLSLGSPASCQGASTPLCTSHTPSRVPGAKLSCSRELFRSISGILLYQERRLSVCGLGAASVTHSITIFSHE